MPKGHGIYSGMLVVICSGSKGKSKRSYILVFAKKPPPIDRALACIYATILHFYNQPGPGGIQGVPPDADWKNNNKVVDESHLRHQPCVAHCHLIGQCVCQVRNPGIRCQS